MARPLPLLLLLSLSAVSALAQEPEYFEEPAPEWVASWGTEAAFNLSDVPDVSVSQHNDGTTNFDTLWLRLIGRLRYGDEAELVIDAFSSNADEPALFGLYARLEPKRWLGARVGLIPLVVGSWQERALPSLQPLIDEPLSAGYLHPIRVDAIPADVDELLSQRGAGRRTRYAFSAGSGSAVAIAYEHCWDTGVELFGQLGGLRYRAALMQGVPGAASPAGGKDNAGKSVQSRLTWQLSPALRLGGSFSRGAYLKQTIEPFLPQGRRPDEYMQQLWGADLRFEKGAVSVHGEWLYNTWDSPYIAPTLETHSWSGEASLELVPGLRAAARASGLLNSSVQDSSGRSLSWDADARRYEAGLSWRFFAERVVLKAVYQRNEIELEPRRVENVAALQLLVSR